MITFSHSFGKECLRVVRNPVFSVSGLKRREHPADLTMGRDNIGAIFISFLDDLTCSWINVSDTFSLTDTPFFSLFLCDSLS